MGFALPYPPDSCRNECRGCGYLGIDPDGMGDVRELDVDGRLRIPVEGIDPHIRCYKGLLTPDKIQRGTKCPKKNAWKYYTKGISPVMALQAERHHTLVWVTIMIAVIIVCVTVIFGILNLMCH